MNLLAPFITPYVPNLAPLICSFESSILNITLLLNTPFNFSIYLLCESIVEILIKKETLQ